MTTDPKPRKRATLNLGEFDDFKPSKPPKASKDSEEMGRQIAADEGFTSRQGVAPAENKIDGRSLRATGRREQLNLAVKQETKNQFWILCREANYSRGEELLEAMMKLWNEKN